MDYQLHTLGTREFEHLSQSLVQKLLGPSVSVFGDGPDGGREATWNGEVTPPGEGSWQGYGVAQAKFRGLQEKPDANLEWLKREITNELKDWAKPDSNRATMPDHLLFITNVRLSGVPGKGKDAAKAHFASEASRLKLPTRGQRIWDYDDLRAFLDAAGGIRRRYAAFITAGDVIAQMMQSLEERSIEVGAAITAATMRALVDDSPVNLTQAGVMSESSATLSDVYVDLPATLISSKGVHRIGFSGIRRFETSTQDEVHPNEIGVDAEEETAEGVAARLIEGLNSARADQSHDTRQSRNYVLVGGPGQGKSTVTQWLSQLYRIEFLKGNAAASKNVSVATASRAALSRAEALSLPSISARRWPFRLVLTELADYLAKNQGNSLIEYISSRISERSSVDVTPADILRWVAVYPWVLFVDGLDEVPPSSNRREVLRALNDFALEVDTRSGDVVTVVTTRPQGYLDEFSDFEHLLLKRLPKGVATACAQALVDVRFGAGSSKGEVVMSRLQRAAVDRTTSRLLESPLQVTILVVLLEKLGRAPGDRFRLFSEYYSVISSREQEKSSELSDLLQRHVSDIDGLHRRVGYRLQKRASEAGGTSATLTRQEFEEEIEAQFREQGHQDAEIDVIVAEFSRLVTERLVFLTFVAGETVGFELRSLQEFMAAQFIVSLRERHILPRLRTISDSSYWRNTFLFAAGAIFAGRDHLRAEVVLLCENLNSRTARDGFLLGSELALGILRDGSCNAMPRYSEPLARLAWALTDGPPSPTHVRQLAQLTDARVVESFAYAQQSPPQSSASAINRALIITADRSVSQIGDDRLREFARALPESIVKDVVRYAWRQSNQRLDAILERAVAVCVPEDFFSRSIPLRMESTLPAAIHLTALASDFFDFDTATGPVLEGCYVPLAANGDSWRWLRGEILASSDWDAVRVIADFAIDPSATTLAAALRAAAKLGGRLGIPSRLPWVLEACLRSAEYWNVGSGPSREEIWHDRLVALAEAASTGRLGDTEDWLRAEANTGKSVHLTSEDLSIFDGIGDLEQAAAAQRVPLGAMNFSLGEWESDEVDALRAIASATLERYFRAEGLERLTLRSIGTFVLAVVASRDEEDGSPSAAERDLAKTAATSYQQDWTLDEVWCSWIDWLDPRGEGEFLGRVFTAIGQSPRFASFERETSATLDWLEENGSTWGQLRFLLVARPSQALADPGRRLLAASDGGVQVEELDRCLAAVRVLRHFMLGEHVDTVGEDLKLVLRHSDDMIGASWLAAAVVDPPADLKVSALQALAVAVSDVDAVQAAFLVQLARSAALSKPPEWASEESCN